MTMLGAEVSIPSHRRRGVRTTGCWRPPSTPTSCYPDPARPRSGRRRGRRCEGAALVDPDPTPSGPYHWALAASQYTHRLLSGPWTATVGSPGGRRRWTAWRRSTHLPRRAGRTTGSWTPPSTPTGCCPAPARPPSGHPTGQWRCSERRWWSQGGCPLPAARAHWASIVSQ